MAESTPVADPATTVPSDEEIARAEKFSHETFVHAGEDPAEALAPGSARRRALDWALYELNDGRKVPSEKWRRKWSLLLGLERVLSEDEPKLADGTTLNPHQVDALSGTLAALLDRGPEGHGDGRRAARVQRPLPCWPSRRSSSSRTTPSWRTSRISRSSTTTNRSPTRTKTKTTSIPRPPPTRSSSRSRPRTPTPHKRFWFEHATGAGKTVAAMGFVDASRTGGVLILTHRRNLVDQFNDELKTRGYSKRISRRAAGGRTGQRRTAR